MPLETITVPGHGPHLITGRQPLTEGHEVLTLVPCSGTGVYRAQVNARGDVVSYKEVRGVKAQRPRGKEAVRE